MERTLLLQCPFGPTVSVLHVFFRNSVTWIFTRSLFNGCDLSQVWTFNVVLPFLKPCSDNVIDLLVKNNRVVFILI